MSVHRWRQLAPQHWLVRRASTAHPAGRRAEIVARATCVRRRRRQTPPEHRVLQVGLAQQAQSRAPDVLQERSQRCSPSLHRCASQRALPALHAQPAAQSPYSAVMATTVRQALQTPQVSFVSPLHQLLRGLFQRRGG
jgi:hypothetical protein